MIPTSLDHRINSTVENIPTEIHSPKFTEIKSIYVAFQVGTHFQ